MVKLILDEYMIKNGVTRYQLSKDTEIKYQTIDNYYKNRVVRYDSFILSKICEALNCKIEDILIYVGDWFKTVSYAKSGVKIHTAFICK